MTKKSESAVPRAYVKSEKPLAPAPAPVSVWALSLVQVERLGQKEWNVVAHEIRGDVVLRSVVVPESNYERLDSAIRDFNSCATQIFRFRRAEDVLAGRA